MASRVRAILDRSATKKRKQESIGMLRMPRRLPLIARCGLQHGCTPRTSAFRATSATIAGMAPAHGCGVKRSVPFSGVSTRPAGTPQALGRSGACRVPHRTATACFRSRFEVSQLPMGPVGTMTVVTGMSGQSCTMAGAATSQTLKAASRKVTLPLGSGSEQCDDRIPPGSPSTLNSLQMWILVYVQTTPMHVL